MLQIKRVSEVINLPVFTELGDKFGEIDEAIVSKNRVESWKIRATRDSFISKNLSGAKGVIIPHQMVKSIGDIMIVARGAAQSYEETNETK